jgi:ribosomal protein S18 acetylase RimI-like enzyme
MDCFRLNRMADIRLCCAAVAGPATEKKRIDLPERRGKKMNQISLVDSKLEIKDAREADLRSMLDVIRASYAEFRDGSPDDFWEKYMINIEEAIMRAPDTQRIAAVLDGELVGSVLLCHKADNSDDPEIRLLAVLPNFRRHGIARQLMEECERRIRLMGKARIVLHTTDLMSIARPWYERSGYVRFESIDFSPVPGFLVMGFAKDLKLQRRIK